MVYHVKVIRKRAERHERKRMQSHKVHAERLSVFEELLNEIYTVRRPKPSDYEVRRDLISAFNEIAKDIYGPSGNVPVVEEFGSFVMDLFHSKSDLDLSVNFDNRLVEFSHEKKIQTLRKFARKLYALQRYGHVSGVHPVIAAKVPVLKVVDCGTKIECDISVENRDGVSKSKIIHMICSLDERFQKLSFLMKAWAKAQNINSSKDKTLNSLSVILLVAFHLQTRNPPILPPFSAILEDGSDPDAVARSLKKFVNYGKQNKESVAELLVTLLIKLLSIEKLWAKGLCASTYEASWLSRTWDSKVCCMSVEDFTDRSQNVARAVGKGEVKRIYKCIQRSSEYISAFMDGIVEVPMLKHHLFGHAAPFQEDSQTKNIKENGNIVALPCSDIKNKEDQSKEGQKGSQSAVPSEPIATKRKCSTDGWEGSTSASSGQSKENGVLPESPWKKGKWSTEGWEGVRSTSWGQLKEDGGPPDSPWSKGKWSTKGWGKESSVNRGQSKGDGVPPDSCRGKASSVNWGQSKGDGVPPDSCTKGWGKASSSNWGQSKGDGVPPDSCTKGWGKASSSKWGQSKGDGVPPDLCTKGWGKASSLNWGQSKGDGAPPDSCTKGWGKASSSNWGQSKGDGVPPDSCTKGWRKASSSSNWGQSKGDGVPPDSFTKGWGKASSSNWGQLKGNGVPPDSCTKGWGKASSSNWGQSKGHGLPPDSFWTNRKRSEQTPGGTSAQWLKKPDTRSWPQRKHNNNYAPKAKWSKMQTGGWGGR
ncbi:protein HESO1 isoform X1 [Capsicum galapagoense]